MHCILTEIDFMGVLVGCLCSQNNLLKIKNLIARPVCVIFDGIKLILAVSQLLLRTDAIPYSPIFIYTRLFNTHFQTITLVR